MQGQGIQNVSRRTSVVKQLAGQVHAGQPQMHADLLGSSVKDIWMPPSRIR